MKRLALLLALCSTAVFAAPWDGTKGTVTVSTIGDRNTIAVLITCSDVTVEFLSVSVVSKFKTITRIVHSDYQTAITCSSLACGAETRNASPSLATFDMPLESVVSISVTELRPGTTQTF
jgi:hypothetical protein